MQTKCSSAWRRERLSYVHVGTGCSRKGALGLSRFPRSPRLGPARKQSRCWALETEEAGQRAKRDSGLGPHLPRAQGRGTCVACCTQRATRPARAGCGQGPSRCPVHTPASSGGLYSSCKVGKWGPGAYRLLGLLETFLPFLGPAGHVRESGRPPTWISLRRLGIAANEGSSHGLHMVPPQLWGQERRAQCQQALVLPLCSWL